MSMECPPPSLLKGEGLDETSLSASDFRRRKNVAMVWEDDAGWACRRPALADQSQRWTWLELVFIRVPPSPEFPPGVALISRWGDAVARYPLEAFSLDVLEDDLLRFEAGDCCDLRKAP